MSITHTFTCLIADGADATIVRPSNWNAAHTITVVAETPSGTIDGANKIFTLTSTPLTNTLDLYHNGIHQWEGVDYTLSTNQITMTDAPIGGADPDTLRAKYL